MNGVKHMEHGLNGWIKPPTAKIPGLVSNQGSNRLLLSRDIFWMKCWTVANQLIKEFVTTRAYVVGKLSILSIEEHSFKIRPFLVPPSQIPVQQKERCQALLTVQG